MSDDMYIRAEYNALRDEIINLRSLASSTLHFSVMAEVIAIGYLFQLKDLSFILFPVPFLIIVPSFYIIISRLQAIYRIGSYIKIFLEKDQGLSWETRWSKLRPKTVKLGKAVYLSYRETIFYLYLCLGILVIGLFISKGFYSRYHIIAYVLFSLFCFHAYSLAKKDCRKIYEKHWQTLKNNENGATDNTV